MLGEAEKKRLEKIAASHQNVWEAFKEVAGKRYEEYLCALEENMPKTQVQKRKELQDIRNRWNASAKQIQDIEDKDLERVLIYFAMNLRGVTTGDGVNKWNIKNVFHDRRSTAVAKCPYTLIPASKSIIIVTVASVSPSRRKKNKPVFVCSCFIFV